MRVRKRLRRGKRRETATLSSTERAENSLFSFSAIADAKRVFLLNEARHGFATDWTARKAPGGGAERQAITMTTLLERPMYKNEYRFNPEAAQRMAFERLVALLTGIGPETGALPLSADVVSETPLGRLARLRAARAVYAINTNGELIRENDGAWTLRHAIV